MKLSGVRLSVSPSVRPIIVARHAAAAGFYYYCVASSASCVGHEDTIRYDTRCYINVRSKANMSQLNLPHGNDN